MILKNDTVQGVINCTRVEVIDNTGRAYTKRTNNKVEISLQDDGRTLKIFIK